MAKIGRQFHLFSIHFIHLSKTTIFVLAMLPISIIEQIKEKTGLAFANAKDFEVLSELFPASDRLGVNTLKRLMGYAKEPIAARKTTLDVIAHYLGQPSWDALMGVQPADSDWVEKAVCADEIKEGSTVEAEWLPDRKIKLLCIGENRFRVMESHHGKLQQNDEVTIHHFRLETPLEVSHIVRKGNVLRDADGAELCYIAGKQNGLKSFTIHEP
jgi:hypothetical protein